MHRRVLLPLLAVLFALCPGQATAGTPAPACPAVEPQLQFDDVYAPPPDALIACVGSTPISGALFAHWYDVARRASALPERSAPALGQVMEFLVSSRWVEGEAAARNIHLSHRGVARAFNRQRRQAFPRLVDFRRFLKQSGETRGDVMYRVRLDLLSERLRRAAVGRRKRPAAQERALNNFVVHFRARWRSRTWCRSEYAYDDCGQ